MMIKGSCLCGQVTYEIHGDMGPITHCHCPSCRKAHASAFSSVSKVALNDLIFTGGESILKYFESSPGKRRYFCSNCGSQIYAKRDDQDHYIWRMGTVDGDPGVRPAQHIFMRYKAPWYPMHDQIPEYDEWAPLPGSKQPEFTGDKVALYESIQALLTHAKNRGTPTSMLLLSFIVAEAAFAGIAATMQHQIRNNVRNSDQIITMNQAQFAVLLPYTGVSAAMVLGERIRNTARAHFPGTSCGVGAATIASETLNHKIGMSDIDSLLAMVREANQQSQQLDNHPVCHFDKLKRS